MQAAQAFDLAPEVSRAFLLSKTSFRKFQDFPYIDLEKVSNK